MRFKGHGSAVLVFLVSFMAMAATSSAQTNPVPLIDQPLAPSAAIPGGPGFTLTVNGTGFVSSSVVNWNGSARVTQFVSSVQLTATIPASDIATPSTASVTVTNPGPGGTSNAVFFEVIGPASFLAFNPSAVTADMFPYKVVVADFNGDGKLDLAVFGEEFGRVTIFLGNGDGTFHNSGQYAADSATSGSGLAVGDFNGDGKLDLAVSVGAGLDKVSILLGNGDGTFQLPVSYPTGHTALAVVTGDFNGDGKLDLATVNFSDDTISVLLGNGDGTFQNHVDYATGSGPVTLALGDFNGDGKLDLVSRDDGSDTVSILLGNGDGTFRPHTEYPVGLGAASIAAADFNGDGKLDLAATNFVDDTVSILLGNGDGTFQRQVVYPTGQGPAGVTVGDLNGDGKVDLAVSNLGSGFGAGTATVSILLGNGDGTFQPRTDFGVGESTGFAIAAGDFNDDGRMDLVVSDNDPNGQVITVLLNASGAGPSPAVTRSASTLDFGSQMTGTSVNSGTTLTNSGAGVLNISSITITGADPGEFSESNTCGVAIQPGVGCFVSVTFSPLAIGTQTALVSITDNVAGSPQTVTLTGVGFGPVATLSPTSLTFASQLLGSTSAPQAVTLTNTGDRALSIASIEILGFEGGEFASSSPCGTSLSAGASCTVTITFTPNAVGTQTAQLVFTDNGPGSPQIVELTGTGVVPEASLSQTSLPFGNVTVGNTTAQPISLQNVGSAALTITGFSITGTNSTDFAETNNCGSSLSAGGSCTINLMFAPTASGSRTATLAVSDDASGSPQLVTLTGVGTDPAPAVTFQPTNALSYGSIVNGANSMQSISLKNGGNATLQISSLSAINGANAADFAFAAGNTCTAGAQVAANATCTISVTFTPRASPATTETASFTITDNANPPTQTVTLTGAGMDFTFSAAGGASMSATVAPGQTAAYNLQLSGANGFTGSVSLTCAGAPAGATCGLPGSISLAGAPAQFTVTITTAGASQMPPPTKRLPPPSALFEFSVALLLFLFALRLGHRKMPRLKPALTGFGLALLLVTFAACGGGGGSSGGSGGPSGTPAGSFPITVTGTDAGLSHSIKLTLNVS
jgi:hypothetical protein